MATKKERVARKGSITALMIGLLSLVNVPSDEELIRRAKEAKKGSKFGKAQLAWYKSKFRTGQLTGMDRKTHAINQKQAPKKAATKPASKSQAKRTAAQTGLPKPKKAVAATE